MITYLPAKKKNKKVRSVFPFLHKYVCPYISKSVDCVCLLAKMKWHGSSAVLIQCGGDSWAWRLGAAHVIFCPGAPDLSHPKKLSLPIIHNPGLHLTDALLVSVSLLSD